MQINLLNNNLGNCYKAWLAIWNLGGPILILCSDLREPLGQDSVQ
jgi:hypothetical protein